MSASTKDVRPEPRHNLGRVAARRQFLRGAGNLTLGLPFLPSLLARSATAAYTQPKFFVAFATVHGGAFETNMFPADSTLDQATSIPAGYTVRHGQLSAHDDGADRVLSSVLRAPASALTDRIVSKMNVLRSVSDIPFGIAHNSGGHLGNFAAVADPPDPPVAAATPTIDRLMAYSPSFYPDLTGIRMRGIVTGNDADLSWEHSNPLAGTGPVQRLSVEKNTLTLFDTLIGAAGGSQTPPPAVRKPIVDRILSGYRSLRQGNRRLSVEDRRRLDDHIARLSELERRIGDSAPPRSCGNLVRPVRSAHAFGNGEGNPADGVTFYGLINDVIAMAFSCGTTRIATCYMTNPITTFVGNYHQDVAHQATVPAMQTILVDSLRRSFQAGFLDLARKLDAIEYSPGKTLLDQSLVQWTQESGSLTHNSLNTATVTCGSAGGFLRTGLHVDYRDRAARPIRISDTDTAQPGLTHRQWLATVLQSMGINPVEFERNGQTGYGDPYVEPGTDRFATVVRPAVLSRASDVVPLVGA